MNHRAIGIDFRDNFPMVQDRFMSQNGKLVSSPFPSPKCVEIFIKLAGQLKSKPLASRVSEEVHTARKWFIKWCNKQDKLYLKRVIVSPIRNWA